MATERHSTAKRVAAWIFGMLFLLTAILIVVILTFDWNRAKPYINERVSEATGRVFEIRGNLDVKWQRSTDERAGWRRLVPWPRVTAEDIQLGNPAWAKTGPQMARVGAVSAVLDPLPLLVKNVLLAEVEVRDGALALERTTDGGNNWTFKKDDEPSDWEFNVENLILAKGTVRYLDPLIKLDMEADINTIAQPGPKGYGLAWVVTGSYNKAPVTGEGKAGGILMLRDPAAVYPLESRLRIGKNTISVEGTLTQPTKLTEINVNLSLAGPSMASLYPLTGIVLPETPPFATSGHLVGKLDAPSSTWTYEKFKGTVGSSDLSGTLEYSVQKPRPTLKGTLVSNQLLLEDLGPLIGADTSAKRDAASAPKAPPSGKKLPVQKFDTARWGMMDADVHFTGRKIVRTEELPINDMVADLHLKNSVLSLTPLNFGVAGGRVTSTIKLDGSGKVIDAQIRTAARHLQIRKLFPTLESVRASFGEVNADASLSGVGSSMGAILATANGEVKGLVTKGSVSSFILEAAGLNVANVVAAKLFGDKQVELNCLASDFAVKDGLMQTRSFVLDTQDAVINISGNISLADETMALDIRPKSKGVRVISFRSPLYVKGTFANPDVGVNMGRLALKAGSAIALATVAPVAAVLPLVNMGKTEDVDCVRLIAAASAPPEAPPPGVSARTKPLAPAQAEQKANE